MTKLLLLGITGSGKSSISKSIGQALGIKVLEVDQEVIRLNKGLWPKDTDTIRKYMLCINDAALEMDGILYVTSWLSEENMKQFYEKGFKIIELHAKFEELVRRKIKRDNSTQSQIDKFREDSEGYYQVIHDKEIQPLITLSLDTTHMTTESVIQVIRLLALSYGLKKVAQERKTNAGDALLRLTKIGARGPKDLSINHDKYLYEQ